MVFIYKQWKAHKIIQEKTLQISNAMVISISIGFYDENPIDPEINGYLADLDGVRIDIQNVINLFGTKNLNYDIQPKLYLSQNESTYKAYWTEPELVNFLQEASNQLEENLTQEELTSKNRYQGLIVIISCHGLGGYILTSDYKKINKAAIHRIFSVKKPLSRKIPRIFLFDCCSGTNERGCETRVQYNNYASATDAEDDLLRLDLGKNTEVADIEEEQSILWFRDEDNPDYKLVTINAANEGFQSKMRSDTGSYVITALISKLYDNIYHNKNRQFLNEILDEIQEDLHARGKQLMVKTFNNKTEYIKFGVRSNESIIKTHDTNMPDSKALKLEMMHILTRSKEETNAEMSEEKDARDVKGLQGSSLDAKEESTAKVNFDKVMGEEEVFANLEDKKVEASALDSNLEMESVPL